MSTDLLQFFAICDKMTAKGGGFVTEHNAIGLHMERCEEKTGWSMTSSHAHLSHELYFLISGQRRYFLGHTIHDVVPGDLVLVPRTQLHRTVDLGSESYSRFVVYFDETERFTFPKLIGQAHFEQLMSCGCLQLPPHIVTRIAENLEQMERELSTPAAWSTATAYHLLEDILLCALRYGTPKQNCRGEIADKVQEAAHYIAENYGENLSLGDVAKIACMEKTYFSKRFKALTGFGFHEYLTQTRLRAAEQLLRETSLSVTEITAQCGFSGSNYFGDVFRRWKGVSPSQYRKTSRGS